jgi:hypothetical protein
MLVPLLWLCAAGAMGQERVEEQPDPTRLDVERLPPEAIEVTRDLYSHGWFLEVNLGGRGFVGGVGRLSTPGPYFSVGVGYEVVRWLWLKATVEASMHGTDAPAPPSPTVFELFGFLGEVRFQADFSARVAGWIGGEVGVAMTASDVLVTHGLNASNRIGLVYGGQLGIDWHMRSRHHSIGLAGGARHYTSLDGVDGEPAVGIHGSLYLRYVF